MGKGNSRGSRTLADNSGGEVSGGLGVCAPYKDPEYGDGGSTCRYRRGVSTLAPGLLLCVKGVTIILKLQV
jgi:hypothetical protein